MKGGGQILERSYGYLVRCYQRQRGGIKTYTNRKVFTAGHTAADRREAQKALDSMRVQANTGTLRPPTKVTVGALAQRFLCEWAGTKAPKTQDNYRRIIGAHIVPDLGTLMLDELVADHTPIQTWIGGLKRKHAVRGDRGNGKVTMQRTLSPTTQREIVTLLGNMIGHAVKWYRLPLNPMQYVDLPTRDQRKLRGLDAAQFDRLLNATLRDQDAGRYYLAIQLLGYTGMRAGEAARLTFADLDLDKGIGRVKKSKTEAGVREVSLLSGLIHTIRQAKQRRQAKGTDLVLVQPDGKPMDMHNLSQRVLPRLQVLAGLDDLGHIRLHDLRHTYLNIAREADVQVEVVSANMGHARVSITQDLYGRVTTLQRKDGAAKMDRHVQGVAA